MPQVNRAPISNDGSIPVADSQQSMPQSIGLIESLDTLIPSSVISTGFRDVNRGLAINGNVLDALSSDENLTSSDEQKLNPQTINSTKAEQFVGTEMTVRFTGEPLIPSEQTIERSFTYPILYFEGQVSAEETISLKWDAQGTTSISDSRGHGYSLRIPASQGNVTILQNSTVVDQRVVGLNFHYDVIWKPVMRADGYISSYKFMIFGEGNEDSSTISFQVVKGKYLKLYEDSIVVQGTVDPQSAREDNQDYHAADASSSRSAQNETEVGVSMSQDGQLGYLDGLKLDWSDAIKSGYDTKFNSTSSTIEMDVGKSFFVDPVIISTNDSLIAPPSGGYFEGQNRIIVTNGSRINAFYYDHSNIVYRYSDDEGDTWSSATSLGTGTIGSDYNRWSVVSSFFNNNNTQYIDVFYWIYNGTNTNFYVKQGLSSSASITWNPAVLIQTVTANTGCITGSCVSVSASTDSNGNKTYAAFRWAESGATTFSYGIKKSTDGGLSWSDSIAPVTGSSIYRPAMTLAPYGPEQMLFTYLTYESDTLKYRFFNGTVWSSVQTINGTGLSTNTYKQLSSDGGSDAVYVAFTNVTASNGGILKLATFTNSTFASIETADSTLRHNLPSVLHTGNGDINIRTIANGLVYNTRRVNDSWESPSNPYGTSFMSPDQLTASKVMEGMTASLWREKTTYPYNIIFDMVENGVVAKSTIQLSPGSTDYYEGERRVVSNNNGTQFAFYYDGSNIVYSKSFDLGHTWSAYATSTGTGTIASDNFRWSVSKTAYNGTDIVAILYYTVSGSNTNFYQKSFKLFDSGLQLVGTTNSFSAANDVSCSPTGVCAAATGSSDSNSTLYASYRWKSGGTWHFNILKSSDGGSSWMTSLGTQNVTSTTHPIVMSLTSLDDGKMLFSYLLYEENVLDYKIYNGSTWNGTFVGSIGMSANTTKQISSGTLDLHAVNGTKSAFVAYLTGGNTGTLKTARFSGNGTFAAIETAESTLSHSLPSVTVAPDSIVRVYSLSGGVIYDTARNETGWETPTADYGYDFYSPDQLTAQVGGHGATGVLWRGGSSPPFTLTFAGRVAGTIGTTTFLSSPSVSDYYEGEKRVVRSGSSLFAFYYDGSTIAYRQSSNNGNTWGNQFNLGTGTIASDYYRWTIQTTTIGGIKYIAVLYYTISGSNTNFYALRGVVGTTSISFGSPTLLFSVGNVAACNPGTCAAATASIDTNGYIYAAYRWVDGASSAYYYRIMKSTDGGATWTTSLTSVNSGASTRIEMGLTKLSSGKMLFAYLRYDSSIIRYRVFDGTIWGSPQNFSAGMYSNTVKQMSMASDNNNVPYLTYLTSGTYGWLMVATWTNSGTSPSYTKIDSIYSHSLPSITVRPDNNIPTIYSISSGQVLVSHLVNGQWILPITPYGKSTVPTSQLTVGLGFANSYAPVMWLEYSSPYIIRESGILEMTYYPTAICTNLYVSTTNVCEKEDFVVDTYTYKYTTPTNLFQHDNIAYCSWPEPVKTQLKVSYPATRTLKDGSANVNFQRGVHWGWANVPTYFYRIVPLGFPYTWDKGAVGADTVIIGNYLKWITYGCVPAKNLTEMGLTYVYYNDNDPLKLSIAIFYITLQYGYAY